MPDTNSMITIDFWNTLVEGKSGGKIRRDVRLKALRKIALNYVEDLSNDEVEEASRETSREFRRIWFDQQRTPTTLELVRHILNHLGIDATQKEMEYLVEAFEESLWVGPPDFVEGVEEVLPELARNYYLAVISDTMYSPGRVLRKFLENSGLASHFDGFVFSDETGFSKPHPEAYTLLLDQAGCSARHSWHIGDLMKTDIRGAKQVGMKAILFTGVKGREDYNDDSDVEPDHICDSWEEIGELLL